ncbi:MAG: glycosyltransferase family 2 protein [Bradyrhizobium sp.]|uniref:glycosyltransferase family 2 protein n=1 Tax=Bradyrhizobium sp. TaxID=376 RepID=UPI0012025DD5|nr:glycosyltransferase family 2 protein [Bradyrhizobium sp.]THD64005.1 MAG: glycosyltransferase family 2 protein [Bradyrhizobium sp.]
MDRPPISVIVPTYNRAALLPAAIESVRAQTRPDWELIIVDDGSTDETSAAIAPLLREDPRLRLLVNEGARGPAGARNTGIRAARGAVLGFLDSDDYWEPSKLARFMVEFDAVPAAVLVASDNCMVDRDSSSVTTMKSFLLKTMVPWWQTDPLAREVTRCDALARDIQTIAQPGLFASLTIAGFPWVHTSSTMIRRDAAFAAGLFDEGLMRTEDIDLWLRLESMGRFVYIDEVLARYDITGRDGGAGARYASYHPSRRHTRYVEASYHLRLLDRVERHCRLTTDQSKLLTRRRISHHRHCAVEALRERYWPGLVHAIPCMKNPFERDILIRQMRDVLFRGTGLQ